MGRLWEQIDRSWLPDLPTLALPSLPDWLPWLRYLVPVGVAAAAAWREVDRRQARARREADYQQAPSPLREATVDDVEALVVDQTAPRGETDADR